MKLWQKTALLCAAALLCVAAACSALLLAYTRSALLDAARDGAAGRQQALAASFCELAGRYLRADDSEAVQAAVAGYCFSRFAGDSGVLLRGGRTLYSAVSADPLALLPLPEDALRPRLAEGTAGGRRVLTAGSAVTLHGTAYAVYVVEDVTGVYEDVARMAAAFLLLSAACALPGAGIVALLLRRGARPLTELAGAARRIADGEYGIRARVRTRDEVGTLAGDFNAMADALEARIAELAGTAERQRLFIGGVTHEFRTPLTALLLHARLLRRANMTDAERDASLEHIEQQCQWLERLVQALLGIVALGREAGRAPCKTDALFARVRQSAEQALAARGAALETRADGGTLLIDADLMRSLLVNLVDNAAKAYDPGAPGARVLLAAGGGEITVTDHGRGIPPEALAHIFEPFYTVDRSRSKRRGGSGLGLALVKAVADAHGAALTVESAPGRGTVVRLTLPPERVLPAGAGPDGANRPGGE